MAKFNPYKINPFKVLNAIGWVLKIALMALTLGVFCYATVSMVWDSWGWWALTMPLIWIVGVVTVIAVAFFIRYGYEILKSRYEDAKWDYERAKARQDFEALESEHV